MSLVHDDLNVGGVTRDLVEAVAGQLAALYEQLAAVYESAFVETAEPRRWLRLTAAVLVAVGIGCGGVKYRKRKASGLGE